MCAGAGDFRDGNRRNIKNMLNLNGLPGLTTNYFQYTSQKQVPDRNQTKNWKEVQKKPNALNKME